MTTESAQIIKDSSPKTPLFHETRLLLGMVWRKVCQLLTMAVVVFILTLSAMFAIRLYSLNLSAVYVSCGTYTLDSNHAYIEVSTHGTRLATIALECDTVKSLGN